MKTFAQEAEEIYNEMRTAGKDYVITALYVDLSLTIFEASLLFEQLEAGDPVEITTETVTAYKLEKGLK